MNLKPTGRLLIVFRSSPIGYHQPTIRRLLGAALAARSCAHGRCVRGMHVGISCVLLLVVGGEHAATSLRCRTARAARSRIAHPSAGCHSLPAGCPRRIRPARARTRAPSPLAARCGIGSEHPLEANCSRVWAGAAPAVTSEHALLLEVRVGAPLGALASAVGDGARRTPGPPGGHSRCHTVPCHSSSGGPATALV